MGNCNYVKIGCATRKYVRIFFYNYKEILIKRSDMPYQTDHGKKMIRRQIELWNGTTKAIPWTTLEGMAEWGPERYQTMLIERDKNAKPFEFESRTESDVLNVAADE